MHVVCVNECVMASLLKPKVIFFRIYDRHYSSTIIQNTMFLGAIPW